MEKNREKNRENEENQRNNPVPLKTAGMLFLLRWMKVPFNTLPLMQRMVFRKRMEKQISTETLEILMPFLKVVW